MSLRISVKVFLPVIAGVALTLVFLLFAGHEGGAGAAAANGALIRYVATTGNDPGNDCSSGSAPCGNPTIPSAVIGSPPMA